MYTEHKVTFTGSLSQIFLQKKRENQAIKLNFFLQDQDWQLVKAKNKKIVTCLVRKYINCPE